jgi:ATP phosphoribosyltransferase
MRLALTRGSALGPAIDLLAAAGLPVATLRNDVQKCVCELADGTTVVLLQPADVPIYVAAGAADVGIAGKDWLLEQGCDLYELLDLRLTPSRIVFAQPRAPTGGGRRRLGRLRVATTYAHITERYFARSGRQVEVIPLQTDVDLAPRLGLAEGVVMRVDDDGVLRGLALVEQAEIARSSLRLVASRAAHTLLSAEVQALMVRLRALVEGR